MDQRQDLLAAAHDNAKANTTESRWLLERAARRYLEDIDHPERRERD